MTDGELESVSGVRSQIIRSNSLPASLTVSVFGKSALRKGLEKARSMTRRKKMAELIGIVCGRR
jgi:hypothetical protein